MSPTVRHRNNSSISKPNFKKDLKKIQDRKSDLKHSSKHEESDKQEAPLVFPATDIAFKALLSARFCAAIWSHVSDCDETFNYWEPMHYLIYGQGLQTWEYSPQFALRSYAYLLLHAVPAWAYHKLLQPNPMLLFYLVRCILGLATAMIEVYFYKALTREFGVHVSRLWLCFQLFSAGMFISSTALLPSTFAMYLGTISLAAWWQGHFATAVFCIAVSALLGWPFAVIIGIPIALDILFRRNEYFNFVKWTVLSGVVVLVPMVLIDSTYYGLPVIAPLNIIIYNVFTTHGPNLYGVEPLSFYLINGFLNYNFVWILALSVPVLLMLNYFFVPARSPSTLTVPYWLSLAPLYIWIVVFFTQPHKEERFLFPVYPLISLAGAISVDVSQKIYFRLMKLFKSSAKLVRTHYLNHTMFITIFVMAVTSCLGISRILALYNNYHAPLDLMMEFNKLPATYTFRDDVTYNLCVGKDWYRFPNSFFLPNKNFKLRFIKSEFNGMLPAYYSDHANATKIIPEYFNDQNKENEALYFDINKCHFLLDLNTGSESNLEPNYAAQKKNWTVLKSFPFINVLKSNMFYRAFFIPIFSSDYTVFGDFNLLISTKFKLT